ncbi:MAG: hypothetical protein ACRD0N_08935 [Acidimicrobiales bacterium]
MTVYDDLVATADQLYQRGEWKEASIAYGRALIAGGPRDGYCRRLRGASARRVAEQRLDKAAADPEGGRPYLDQAARWLSKAEAYLDSALEDATTAQQAEIRMEQAHAEETVARFLQLCGADPARRLSMAREHRRKAEALQG